MRLWQKIFLLTLALVIIVVNVTSLALQFSNHRLAIEREQQNSSSRHSSLIAEFQNMVTITQIIERVTPLGDEETLAVVLDVAQRRESDTVSLSLYRDGVLVYSKLGGFVGADLDLLAQPDYTSAIVEEDGKTLLLIVSTTILNERTYQLISITDISSTYDLYRAGFNQIRIIGIVSALIVAGLLVALVFGLLTPLRNLSSTTHMIAQGDLDNRATVTGNDEVSEVARDFNTMADSIEHNIIELERLAESRRIFIGNLAHEMKTPLTSILGFADILRIKREVSDLERISYANVIVNETKRLQGLSGRLMELLTLGTPDIPLAKAEVHELIHELVTTLQPIIESNEIKLVVVLPRRRAYINVDRELVKSLIYNLIDNSLKASNPNGIIYLIESLQDNRVILQVVDEGIGIPEDQIPLLTEPFYMLDKARTRKHGGAGLGLALCAEIARIHGTELKITSELGKGTSVSVAFDEVTDNG
ncbi:MAG: HAMP domain-containing histidine kinase [Coriobacteriia bacterium]|nr:HAMP domain-containing histidine kinase [Coriobacteriia bacterium]